MSAQLPNGALIAIAASYGAAKTMSAITNATEAVATLEASHGVVENDILEVTSGWLKLNNRIVRADSVSTNDVTFEDINTSSTTNYPAGTGTGTVREIATWAQIAQIMENNPQGGEQQYVEFQFLEDKVQRRLATIKTAQGFELVIADDPTLACYPILQAADEDGLPRALRLTLPSGAVIYYNAQISFDDNPRTQANNVITVRASASFVAKFTRYSA